MMYMKYYVFNNENENKLFFLDLIIIRTINYKLNKKKMVRKSDKRQLINFYSNYPFYQKKNGVNNLIRKAISLTDTSNLNESKM